MKLHTWLELMVINALLFHGRLEWLSPSIPERPSHINNPQYGGEIQLAWIEILRMDYWPIFRKAFEVVSRMTMFDRHPFLIECARAADELAIQAFSGRHDLAGQIFNRLVADRKFLAAFYTSIPAATLLAGLALDEDRWDEMDLV